jgi:Flp pilus assembly protein TadG
MHKLTKRPSEKTNLTLKVWALSRSTFGRSRGRVGLLFEPRIRAWNRVAGGNRAGTILVITAIVMIALVGLLGLVVDAGQLMTAHREIQNSADAAATAAAMDLLNGASNSTAITTGTTFVQQYNGKTNATVVINIPPVTGPHLGDSRFAEATVTNTVTTRFIQVVGIGTSQTVKARAVAGWEGTSSGAGVIALDKNARPGINLVGNGSLKVNGTVVVNSNGGGLNQSGAPIGNGQSGNAITTAGNGKLYASDVESVGGVSSISSIKNFNAGNPASPLHTGTVAQPDPYQYQGGGLTMAGNSTLTGSNVMLYNTGSDYNVSTGLPDSGDGSSSPPASGNATFAGVSITGNAQINLTPFTNASSPFDGLVYYQRRLNTQAFKIAGNGSSDVLKGTVYAKWANLDLSGNGTFNSQFVVKSLDFTGNGSLTLDITGQHVAKSDQVFLVE